MRPLKSFAALAALVTLAACATVTPVPTVPVADAGWTAAEVSTREVDLGLPGGAQLADHIRFIGGLEILAAADSPVHSLSDLKTTQDWLYSVTDAGDLIRFRIGYDAVSQDPTSIERMELRRLSLADGSPIVEKEDGDAEGMFITPEGRLAISFERKHRLWDYGPLPGLAAPRELRIPDVTFPLNDGMEGISIAPGGWRVTGENGGVWDCSSAACREVVAVPNPPLADSDYRITGLDRDPSGDGFYVLQRSFSPPIDARARVRHMDAQGNLGPVLIELKLPGTTDNFEGLAAQSWGDSVRLFLLSDDNNSARQRTLLLMFDID